MVANTSEGLIDGVQGRGAQLRKISWLRYVLYCVVFGNCKRLDGLMGCGMRYGILTMPNDDQEKQESILKTISAFCVPNCCCDVNRLECL